MQQLLHRALLRHLAQDLALLERCLGLFALLKSLRFLGRGHYCELAQLALKIHSNGLADRIEVLHGVGVHLDELAGRRLGWFAAVGVLQRCQPLKELLADIILLGDAAEHYKS